MSLGFIEVVQEGRRQEVPLLKGVLTIGRAGDNDLVLTDRTVSNYHARMVSSPRGWRVFDLGSANGTFVDGERLFTFDSRTINDGGSLRVGVVSIVLHLGISAEPSAAAATDGATPVADEFAEMAALLAEAPPPPPADATPPPRRSDDLFADLPRRRTPRIGSSPPATPADAAAPRPAPMAEATPLPEAWREIWILLLAGTGPARQVHCRQSQLGIGRADDCEVRIDDPAVALRHAQLVYHRGTWRIVDVGATPPPLVDGVQLAPHTPQALADGSTITLAGTTITLQRHVWQLAVSEAAGRQYHVEVAQTPFTIGRAGDQSLTLTDPALVARHAQLIHDGDGWSVVDLGGTAGTYVDRERLLAQYPRALGAASVITLGRFELVLSLGPASMLTALAEEQAAPAGGAGKRGALIDTLLSEIDAPAAAPPNDAGTARRQRAAPSRPLDLIDDGATLRPRITAAPRPMTPPVPRATPPPAAPTPAPPPPAAPAMPRGLFERDAAPVDRAPLRRFATWFGDLPLYRRLVTNPLSRMLRRIPETGAVGRASRVLRDWFGIRLGLDETLGDMAERVATPWTDAADRAPQQAPAPTAAADRAPQQAPAPTAAADRPPQQPPAAIVRNQRSELPAAAESEHIALLVAASALLVDPGTAVTFGIAVTNRASVVDRIAPGIAGVPASWVTVAPEALALMPAARGEAQITIAPPRDCASLAGMYHLAVIARSDQHPTEQAVAQLLLTVQPFTQFRAELRPRQTGGVRGAEVFCEIHNESNRTVLFDVQGTDDEEALAFAIDPPRPAVPAGRMRRVRIWVRGRRWLWFGTAPQRFFTVTTTPDEHSAPPQQSPARYLQQPIVSWPLLIVSVVLLLLLIGPWLWGWYQVLTRPPDTPATQTAAALAVATVEPSPEPVIEPSPEPVIEPSPEPVIEPSPEPVIEPSPEPVVEPSPEPVVEPTPEPVIAPTPEPVIAPTPEPVIVPSPTATNQLACSTGTPVELRGSGAPRRSAVLLFFDGRAVGGGTSDDAGNFAVTLRVGDEAPGRYPVEVRARAGGSLLLVRTCVVPVAEGGE